jgi:hypothetical protein
MLFLKHTFEQPWCDFIQVRACLLPKAEALERYPRPSELLAVAPPHIGRNDRRCGVYTNPIYLKGYILGAMVWPLPTDANYRAKTIVPDLTHTIMTTKRARRVGITCMRPLVYERLSHAIANRIISPFRSTDRGHPASAR